MTDLFTISDATWPPYATHVVGGILVRDGAGGGQRVSAATALADWTSRDIDAAESLQRSLSQTNIFMIRHGEEPLDRVLATRSYAQKDPVNIYEAPIAGLAAVPARRMTTFDIWPPLAAMRDIWAEGGIGPARLAVMNRVAGPKTAILGRVNDRIAGAAFVAIHSDTAMLHALHIVPEQRRQGSAVNMMRKAAEWAQDHGATRFSVLVTKANDAANALYASLGMQVVGQYHYRIKLP